MYSSSLPHAPGASRRGVRGSRKTLQLPNSVRNVLICRHNQHFRSYLSFFILKSILRSRLQKAGAFNFNGCRPKRARPPILTVYLKPLKMNENKKSMPLGAHQNRAGTPAKRAREHPCRPNIVYSSAGRAKGTAFAAKSQSFSVLLLFLLHPAE